MRNDQSQHTPPLPSDRRHVRTGTRHRTNDTNNTTTRRSLPALLFFALVGLLLLVGCPDTEKLPAPLLAHLHALRANKAPTRWKAAQALGKHKTRHTRVLKALTKALEDPHWLVQSYAAEALMQKGKSMIPFFIDALGKHNLSYRLKGKVAFARLVRARAEWVLPALAKRASLYEGRTRSWALAAMTIAGRQSIPHLRRLTRSPNNDLRASTARALKELGPLAQLAQSDLRKLLGDHSSYVRRQAAMTLGALKPMSPKVAKKLTTLLVKDENVRVKIDAANALAKAQAASLPAVQALQRLVRSQGMLTFFRYRALPPLGALTTQLHSKHPNQTPATVKLLIGMLQDRMASLRIQSLQTLKQMGALASPAVLTMLAMIKAKHPLKRLHIRALKAIATWEQIVGLRLSRHPIDQRLAIILLQPKHGAKAIPFLVQRLESPKSKQRELALQALQAFPVALRQSAWPQVYKLAQGDPNTQVRATAIQWLAKLPKHIHITQAPKPSPTKPAPKPTPKPQKPPQPSSQPASQPSQPASKPSHMGTNTPGRQAPSSRPNPHQTATTQATQRTQPPAPRNATKRTIGPKVSQGYTLYTRALQAAIPIRRQALLALGGIASTHQKAWMALLGQLRASLPVTLRAPLCQALLEAGHTLSEGHIDLLLQWARHPKGAAVLPLLGKQVGSTRRTQRNLLSTRFKEALQDKTPRVRDFADRGIIRWLEALKDISQRPYPQARRHVQYQLSALLHSPSSLQRERGLMLLEKAPAFFRNDFAPLLKETFTGDRHPACRAKAAGLLRSQTPIPVPFTHWVQALYDEDGDVRLEALQAIDTYRQQGHTIKIALPALEALIRAEDPSTESRAIELIGHLGPQAAHLKPLLSQRTDATSWYVRAHAVQALLKLQPNAPENQKLLQQAANDPDPRVRNALSPLKRQLSPKK